MKHHRIVGAMLLTAALNAFGDSSSGTCDTFATGQWVSRGVQPFSECLQMLAVSSTGETISLGRWRGVLIAKDRVGVLLSYDAGRSWQAFQGRAPEPVDSDSRPDTPLEAAVILPAAPPDSAPPDIATPGATDPPADAALASQQQDTQPSSTVDQSPVANEPILQPPTISQGAELDEEAANNSPADASPAPQQDNTPTPDMDAGPLVAEESEAPPPATSAVTAPGEVATIAPPSDDGAADEIIATASDDTPVGIEPGETPDSDISRRALSPDDCRLRVPVGWIHSTAPTLKACAKLLDQSAEQYDAQGYKYAYWRQALLVANRSAVFTFDAESQWTLVLKRHRY